MPAIEPLRVEGVIDMTVTREQVLAQLYPDEPDYEGAARLGPEALPHLMQLIEEGDPDLASKAASLAGVIDAAGSADVVDTAARSPEAVIRVAAAAALGNLSEMPGPLAQGMLNDEDVGVRKLALRSLERQQPAGFKQKAQQMAANDPNPVLREHAARIADQLP
jgi:HEAT repeat protein